MNFFLAATVATLLLPPSVWAAPKSKPVARPGAVVEPRARALFARAHKLYSGLRGLRLQWTVLDSQTNTIDARELRLDPKGRLFLRGHFGPFSVSTIKGETSLLYSDRLNTFIKEDVKQQGGTRSAVANQLVEAAFNHEGTVDELIAIVGASASAGHFSGNPLSVEAVQGGLRSEEFLTLHATVLPSRSFRGEVCDLVRIVKVRSAPGAMDNAPNVTRDQTYWFARSNGRLMRLQVPLARAEDGQTDAQITFQRFNPKFGAKDFTFALPKDAKPYL